MRAASAIGVRHRLAGEGSDDSYAWAHDDDTLVVAVADGVGSLPGSAATAARACAAAVGEGLARAANGTPEEAAMAAVVAANVAAAGGGATTLVVAIVRREGGGAIGRVGDSSAWSIEPGGLVEELFDPPDPERADTATAALPVSDLDAEARPISLGKRQVLALVTDGIADPLRDGPATVAPALSAALLARPDPIQMLSLADFSRQGCHDDRTIVGVWLD